MEIIEDRDELREILNVWRRAGEHVALVPTMGNLHEGHLSLLALAREHAERVVVTVFVNPTQFGEGEDFDKYPRTLERDKIHLKRANVDILFVPAVETIYPFGTNAATSVTVPVLTEELCGLQRPGHFDGVTSVVSRLLSMVQPDVAVFGQKDYQQQLVIRRMVADMHLPTEIICGPTLRDEDGLALSSRNQYLTEEELKVAPQLYLALQDIGKELQSGNDDYAALEQQATKTLEKSGFKPEYVSIRRAENLGEPDRETDKLVVLAAAQLGNARLIDNIVVEN
ncbi:MAG: pantoate--beta-alanine ligase [Woeseia sp.]|nr:pantoate--beta-alanine ligase [Woeseia sp.]NNL55688.1 pantoate--beta-alanine ligase [Woeseia sp.]